MTEHGNADSGELSPRARARAERLATARMQRELATIRVMTRLYCRDHHGATARDASGHCSACAELFDYQHRRLLACPFSPDKPTCSNCQVHCFGPRQREATREVMRHAGPRMLLRHPVLAIAHVLDGRRPAPPKPRPSSGSDRGQPPAA
jgi:hypothetical protein